MAAVSNLHARLAPPDIIREAGYGRTHFLSLYGDAPLVLVSLGAGQDELESGLSFTAVESTIESVRPGTPLQFRTQMQSQSDAFSAAGQPMNPSALQRRLGGSRHFMVPVRKRRDSESLSQTRITVGRAFNQDIVLRHSSVSKFHAWFEVDGDVTRLADAGSSNGTRINDELLPPKQLMPLRPGDAVRFGAIACIVSDAETMFELLTVG